MEHVPHLQNKECHGIQTVLAGTVTASEEVSFYSSVLTQ